MRGSTLEIWMVAFFSTMLILPAVALAQDAGYKMFHSDDYIKMANPNPGFFRGDLVTDKENAKHLHGIFGFLPPPSSGAKIPYHYHKERESVLFIITGEGVGIFDGKEVPFKAGDVIFLLSGVKHTIVNKSNADIRYLEFFTNPPLAADFVEVK